MQRGRADQVDAQRVEAAVEPLAHDAAGELRAGERVVARVADLAFADEARDVADADLERVGPRAPAGAGYGDAVGRDLVQRHAGEICGDIGREVGVRIRDLVEQLLGGGGDVQHAAGPVELAERRGAVGVDVREREAEAREPGHVLAAGIGVVAAAQLAGALEQVAHYRAAGQALDVVGRPTECVHQRRDEERRVGDAAGDDDLCAAVDRGQQRVRAEIGIRGHDRAVRGQWLAGLERAHVVVDRVEHIVAGDGRDARGHAEAARDRDDRSAAASGLAAPKLLQRRVPRAARTGNSASMRAARRSS
jgi:hypothetical protein